MDQRVPCPLCRHGNLPENRFCGHCGALLTGGGQLTPRPEAKPTMAIHSLPTKLGPAGKALAVGLAVLATEAGLVWLRRRGAYNDRLSPRPPPELLNLLTSSTLSVRAWRKYLFGCRRKGTSRAEALDDG